MARVGEPMKRVPATELERDDWLVCSDGTRVRIAHITHEAEQVRIRLVVTDTHQAHPEFWVASSTKFLREDSSYAGATEGRK